MRAEEIARNEPDKDNRATSEDQMGTKNVE